MGRPQATGRVAILHGQVSTFPAPARIPASSTQLKLGAEGRERRRETGLFPAGELWLGKGQEHPEPAHSKGACWHLCSQSLSLLGPNPA